MLVTLCLALVYSTLPEQQHWALLCELCEQTAAVMKKSSFLFFVQGHYRYCEALFSLGHYEMAIKANKLAQMLCKDDHEGVKDLETQFCKYKTTHPMAHPGPPRGYVSGKLKNPVFLQWLMVKGYFFFLFCCWMFPLFTFQLRSFYWF